MTAPEPDRRCPLCPFRRDCPECAWSGGEQPKSRVAQPVRETMRVAKTDDPGLQPEAVLSHPTESDGRMTVANIVATPHLDGCPECMTRGNAPITTEPTPGGVQCSYVCWSCGGWWQTSWWGGAA